MKRSPILPALVALASTVLLAGCPDDVAPGYRIEKQAVAVRFDGSLVQIQADYWLRNTGRDPRDALTISLASVNPGAASDMRVQMDGKPVDWQPSAHDGERALELKFLPAWARKTRKHLTLEYSFRSGTPQSNTRQFQLVPGSWSPEFVPPPGPLAKAAGPQNWELSVTVPAQMLVNAMGKPRGVKRRGSNVEYRFRQDKGHTFTYIVAGHYTETRIRAGDFTFRFWMQQQVEPAHMKQIADRLAQTVRLYREWLGPLENDAKEFWVVDGTGGRYILGGARGSRPGLAPNMIVDPGMIIARGNAEMICVADEGLAGMWLHWLSRPEPNADFIAENLAKHFAQSLPHGCGASSPGQTTRSAMIAALRRSYAAADANFRADTGKLKESYRREREGYRGRLMVLAMEQQAGAEALRRSVRRVLQAMRSDTWGQNELRSAIEAETGRAWAAFFRDWNDPEKLPAE